MMGADLLLVVSLSEGGRSGFAPLYRFLESAGEALTRCLLHGVYDQIRVVEGSSGRGLAELAEAVAKSEGRTLDVVLMVHGQPGRLWLGADPVPLDDFVACFRGANLRILYSTACYGASHGPAFLAAGFRTVVGAKAVNANGATEVPVLFALLAAGKPVGEALAIAQAEITREPADAAARLLGFRDVCSEKELLGDPNVTLSVSNVETTPPVQP